MPSPSNRSRPGHAALRKGRRSQSQRIYFITFVTTNRLQLFADFNLACTTVRSFVDPRNWQDARLLAWVLMPDHWHGLVELGPKRGLSCLVGALKAHSSKVARAGRPGSGPIWARSFHDRALRHEDDLVVTARYLVMNPVRAGLVTRINDYPFWDAVWI